MSPRHSKENSRPPDPAPSTTRRGTVISRGHAPIPRVTRSSAKGKATALVSLDHLQPPPKKRVKKTWDPSSESPGRSSRSIHIPAASGATLPPVPTTTKSTAGAAGRPGLFQDLNAADSGREPESELDGSDEDQDHPETGSAQGPSQGAHDFQDSNARDGLTGARAAATRQSVGVGRPAPSSSKHSYEDLLQVCSFRRTVKGRV